MRNALAILWPSFLVAAVLEMLVFSAVRPGDVQGFGGALAGLPPIGVYTLAFFSFWLIAAVGIALALNLSKGPRTSDQEVGVD